MTKVIGLRGGKRGGAMVEKSKKAPAGFSIYEATNSPPAQSDHFCHPLSFTFVIL
jgi:hypothetical protein